MRPIGPAIAIPAYNRPHALRRLLGSLLAADIPQHTPLVIAVDRPPPGSTTDGNADVLALVRELRWPFGEQRVIAHENHLGLRGNVTHCGRYASEFGAVVLLEDDLYVSPRFFDYAAAALAYFAADPRVAGISLNQLWFNGFTNQPFMPLIDALDVFFLQLATPQGQAYTAEQWTRYEIWLSNNPQPSLERLHPIFADFPESDWLPQCDAFLVDTGAFYVYPRASLTTNFGDEGTHMRGDTTAFQVPLVLGPRKATLGSIDESLAVYDAFYEWLPDRLKRVVPGLAGVDVEMDLYATKPATLIRADHVITTRTTRRAVESYGKVMRPLEMNIVAGIEGRGITLARREDVDFGAAATRDALRDNDRYFERDGDGLRVRLARRMRNRR